jgi:hypothetical protein
VVRALDFRFNIDGRANVSLTVTISAPGKNFGRSCLRSVRTVRKQTNRFRSCPINAELLDLANPIVLGSLTVVDAALHYLPARYAPYL